jgi:hypothetical protein
MSRKEKPADRVNINRRNILRSLLVRGEVEEAGKRAHEWGIDILDIRLPADADAPPEVVAEPDEVMKQIIEPKPPAPEIPTSPAAPSAPIESKWPAETDVVIVGQPPNPRMLVVRLPDQRRAVMWKRGTTHPVHAMVRVKLADQVGSDAYYEPVVN